MKTDSETPLEEKTSEHPCATSQESLQLLEEPLREELPSIKVLGCVIGLCPFSFPLLQPYF